MKNVSIFRVLYALMTLAAAAAVAGSVQAKDGTLLDNVIAKKEIRCAYIPWHPMTIKDPNTGKLSGVFTEVLEKIGANAGLKIVWTEEVNYGSAIQGLKTKRYDMVGSVVWPNTNRALYASFTKPLNYSAFEAYVRPDETRLKTLSDINNPNITIAAIDGEAAEMVAKQDFPLAKRSSLPQMSELAQMLAEVTGGKADVAFLNLTDGNEFLAKNPGKVKRLAPGKPLRIYGNSYMVPKGEEGFREFLNLAIEELINSGYVRSVMNKYGMDEGTYPTALPYAPQTQVESGHFR